MTGIGKLIQQRFESQDFALYCFGAITSIDPLAIKVEDRFTIYNDEIDVLEQHSNALQVGDKVVLLRNHGGQRYLILGRLV